MNVVPHNTVVPISVNRCRDKRRLMNVVPHNTVVPISVNRWRGKRRLMNAVPHIGANTVGAISFNGFCSRDRHAWNTV